MRKIKIILYPLAAAFTVFVMLIAYILGTYSQENFQRLLIRAVNGFSDYDLSISGPFHFNPSLDLSLSATDVTLQSKINENRILIDRFDIDIDLRPFLSGTLLVRDLKVENMDLYFTAARVAKKDDWVTGLLPFPVLEHAVFENVRVFTKDKESHQLTRLKIEAADRDQPVKIQGGGLYREQPFAIQGQLGLLSDLYQNERPFPVELRAEWAQAIFSIHGEIKEPTLGKGMNLRFMFVSPAVSEFFSPEIPIKGRLAAKGRLSGNYDALSLSDFRAELRHHSDLLIEAAGTVGNLSNYKDTSFHLSGYIREPEFLSWILPKKSPEFNRLAIKTDLREEGRSFMLENANISLSAPEGLEVHMTGQTRMIIDRQPFRSMDLRASFTSLRTETVKQYLGNILPEMGPVKGTANITTQGRDFVLSNIDLIAGQGKTTQITANGTVGPWSIRSGSTKRKIALALALKAKKSSGLAKLLDVEYPDIGPVTINARLEGSYREIRLEDIHLEAGFPDRFLVQAKGKINWRGMDSGRPVPYSDFILHGSTPSFRSGFLLYDKNMPDLGPAKASMRIHGKGVVLSGSDLKIIVGSKDTLLISAQGKVEQIFLDHLSHKGIEISATVEGEKTTSLTELFGRSQLPDIGPYEGRFFLLGNSETLRASDVTLKAGNKNGLMLNASGTIDQIPLTGAAKPSGVRIRFDASAPSTADLSGLAGQTVPDLGPLKVVGQLQDQAGQFAVRDLSIIAGSTKHPLLTAKGNIEDLFSQSGIKIDILFDQKTLIKIFDLNPVPELGTLKGNVLLSSRNGNLGIENIKIETDHSELIDLKINGAVEGPLKTGGISLNTEFAINDMASLGKLFDTEFPDLGNVEGSGYLFGKGENIAFKGNIETGKTTLESDISVSFDRSPPLVTGTIRSPNIYLRDFGIHPKESSQKTVKRPAGPMFSRTTWLFEGLKKIDLNLQAVAKKVTGANFFLDKVEAAVTLQGGRLKITPAKFVFSDGSIVFDSEINPGKTAEFTLNIQGRNIQLGDLISELHQPPAIEGNLDLIVDLKSRGSSAHEVASNLSGNIGLMLEGGRIRKRELELLFLNPLGWLFSHGITGNELKISCGLARYKIHQGIANSEILYINGPKLVARGRSEINLKKETIDALANLEKKKLLFNTRVSLQIKGSLADPEVSEAPINSPILKADRYLLSPATAIPQELFGTLWGFVDKKDSAHGSCQGVTAR